MISQEGYGMEVRAISHYLVIYVLNILYFLHA